MIVDTHCHISNRWFEPVETLLFQMDRAGVEHALVIQMLGEYDNSYQQRCAVAHADRLTSFVGIDWTLPNARDTLRLLADAGARGVRLRPGARSPHEDDLAIWREAAASGLVVSCVGTVAQFAEPAFRAIAEELPDLVLLLEHLGGLARPDAGDLEKARDAISTLADLPRVHLKVPGLGQLESRDALIRPGVETGARSLIAEMAASFGAGRLHWGSDFPVVSSREGYANAARWTSDLLPEGDRDLIMGDGIVALLGI